MLLTYYRSSLRYFVFVYIPALAIQAILTEVFALAISEKYFKTPIVFLPFLPLTCAGRKKEKKKKR